MTLSPRSLAITGLIFGSIAFQTCVFAAPLSLAQSPPGAAREPAPNIIVSVDDSGSMGWDINGCATLDFDSVTYNGYSNEPGATGCPTPSTNTNASRIRSLRNALINTFGNPTTGTRGIVNDNRIRLAWQVMWDNGRTSRPAGQTNDQSTLVAGAVNSVQTFSGTHRTNFHNFITSLRATQGTPSHKMMANVNAYMATTGVSSPFANSPGSSTTGYLSCRRTYHIFMTDGAWNSETATSANVGNSDGVATLNLPDGTLYSSTNQTRVYRDAFGGTKGTLGDWAFTNWSTDFQRNLTDNVRPLTNVSTPETVGGVTLQPYWNPKNNPMTWQGVTQHSIGFGNSATSWPGSPTWDSADNMYGGQYSSLVSGSVTWIDLFNASLTPAQNEARRPSDLWHMAFNGRGKYYPARNETALTNAFQQILNDILEQTSRPLVSIATSASRLRADGFAYIAGFNSEQWSGELSAYSVSASTSAVSSTPTWRASAMLDTSTFSVNNRLVLTSPGGTITSSFLWGSLTTAMQADLSGTDGTTTGSLRLNYLRGDRSRERQNGGQFRDRASRLGDIVNSNIWMTGKPSRMAFDHHQHAAFRTAQASRTPVLYVGANDGMLHGFNANTGQEVVAYVPRGVYPNLRDYTQESYAHKYFVDGHPFTGDVDTSGRGDSTTQNGVWRTMLVSGMGGGSKGYFVLDVTTPSAAQVIMDNTLSSDEDIGHIYAQPVVDPVTGSRSEQIVKMNNGRWAVVMGNGYNSTSELPVLLIQYLDGNRALLKIAASSTPGQTNGLSAPRLIDINGDGKVDIAYAGDLQGNLWKFNLTATSDASWSLAGSGPVFTAEYPTGTRQPITVAPLWMAPPEGGIQIAFGTGRNITEADRSSTATHTIYSLRDSSTYASSTSTVSLTSNMAAITGRSQLVAQTVVSTVTSTSSVTNTNPYFNTSQNDVNYGGTSPRRGWYMDLPVSRERVLNNPAVYEGQKFIVSSNVPTVGSSGETCDLSIVAEANYINVFNIFSGKPSLTPVFSTADSSMNMQNATRTRFGTGDYVALKKSSGSELISPRPGATCPEGQLCTEKLRLTTGSTPGARADWREVR